MTSCYLLVSGCCRFGCTTLRRGLTQVLGLTRSITVKSIKALLILGFVFLTNGITFLIVGLTTHMTAFWTLGPSLMALGVVFLAISKSRKYSHGSPSSPSGSEA